MSSVFPDYHIDAPPSLKPTKKYSDISGLPVRNRCVYPHHHTINKTTCKCCMTHTLNTDLSAGKLHRPSDKATLHVLWRVLLHPPSPHWCRYWLPHSSKGNLHCTLKSETLQTRSELLSVWKAVGEAQAPHWKCWSSWAGLVFEESLL